MNNEDFGEGIYWILHAINYDLGGGYDFSCGIDYKNDVFETTYFWGHCDDEDWDDVGFRHFASGLEVTWYKRVGRSTTSNKSLKTLEWFEIVTECLKSIRDKDYREVFGSEPEEWRNPLGALRLTLTGDPDTVDVVRAQHEVEQLVKVLNGVK